MSMLENIDMVTLTSSIIDDKQAFAESYFKDAKRIK